MQCYSCGNPETVVKVRKENIFLKCKACGAVSDVDARHKLNTYILKNPPEEKVSKAEKKCAPCLPARWGPVMRHRGTGRGACTAGLFMVSGKSCLPSSLCRTCAEVANNGAVFWAQQLQGEAPALAACCRLPCWWRGIGRAIALGSQASTSACTCSPCSTS